MQDLFTNTVSSVEYLPLCRVFLIFLLYSFIGWCCEVAYVGIFFEHKFVNRGFLHGPVCSIYGCGGLVVMMLPQEVKSSWVALFFCTMILCSAVEYFTSWEMERMFKMKWWDYSDHKFNIKGRVCLLNSTLFGIMGVVIVRFVQPCVDALVMKLNDTVTLWLASVLAAVYIIDNIATVHKLVDFSTTMAKMKEFGESLKERYGSETWFRGTSITEVFASVKEHAGIERSRFSTAVLQKIESFTSHQPNLEHFVVRFPRLSSTSYRESLSLIRQRISEGIGEKKAASLKKHSDKEA